MGNSLIRATCEGDLPRVQELLREEGVDVNAKNHRGLTSLHWASEKGHLDIAKLLIENDADRNAKDDDGRIPLHHACLNGHLEVTKFLMENDGDVHAKDADGNTPFHAACFKNRLEVAKWLIENCGGAQNDVNIKRNSDGKTVLHVACAQVQLDVVKLLIENGADVSAKDAKDEMTPLHHACIMNASYYDGDPLNVNAEDSWRPSQAARMNRRMEILKLLVENGADINAMQGRFSKRTPLDIVVGNGHLKGVELLLSLGANANAKDINGCTPLHQACVGGHVEMAQLLLRRGAKLTEKTAKGKTPLHIACEENHMEIVWMLVRQNPRMVVEVSD